ncbi:plasmid pRiA4b ORF-3 family protein [Legionella shakespearei]|uniref:Plasmid pRiA4b ORF-3-like protein n=1 Tax=Legionella shakespearei DSM 23087 TaxID=1122169 RepID=A0A0W0YZQ8_9GAMM|nr:plasmid pRiA4b ORF-3 family protein [Legionella shakespearei]KTD62369.1 Plasmid pRiA4b ORF-3-like protein [Legionella shakespearei DSM 23087]
MKIQAPRILKDLEVFLQFIETNHLDVSGNKGLLPNTVIPALNSLMSKPLSLKLKRQQQISYPHINGLYLLARTSGLLQIKATKSKRHLAINEPVRKAWNELNDTEKYFNLMQTWFFRSDDRLITRDCHSRHAVLDDILTFLTKNLKKSLLFKKPVDQQYGLYPIKIHDVALLELFDLIEVIDNSTADVPGWSISKMSITEAGKRFTSLFKKELIESDEQFIEKLLESMNYLNNKENQADDFFQRLKPFFPDWNICIKPLRKTTDKGGYFIKASLSDTIWRRIKIQGTESLDTLALAILDAFNFDDEHLYQFSYTDSFGIVQIVADPRCEEEPDACEVLLGDIDILPGDLIEFHYDFGDDWKFKVQIEKIDPELKIKKPTVVEKEGKAPKQYSYY